MINNIDGSLSDNDTSKAEDEFENVDFYRNSLRNLEFYSKSITSKQICDTMIQSRSSANQIIEIILHKSTYQYQKNYYDKLQEPFIVEWTQQILDDIQMISDVKSSRMERIQNKLEDKEPQKVTIDSWQRSHAESLKKDLSKQKQELNDQIFDNVQAIRKQSHNKSSENFPIDLNDESDGEFDEEDKLRQDKEKQAKFLKQLQLKEQKKKEEMALMAEKLLKSGKENKIKDFTYNYDGQMILINEVKVDKLPQYQTMINYNINQKSDMKQQTKNSKTQKSQSKQQQNLNDQKFDYKIQKFENKLLENTPSVIDRLKLCPGVSININGQIKSQKQKELTKDDLISNNNIKITRSQYMNITKDGNLNRQSMQNQNKKDEKNQEHQQVSETQQLKQDQFKKQEQTRQKDIEKLQKLHGKVVYPNKIQQESFYQSLKSDEQEYYRSFVMSNKFLNTSTSKFLNETKTVPKLNSIDNFNKELMNDRQWGYNTQKGFLPSIKQINKDNIMNITSTLGGRFQKKPREAANIQVLQQGTKLKFLPPQALYSTNSLIKL